MFAKTLAFGALALLLTVPAAQAAPDVACLFRYQTTPYFGPIEALLGVVNRLDACAEPSTEPTSRGAYADCLLLVDELNGEPQIQPFPACERQAPQQPEGPEPLQYNPRAKAPERVFILPDPAPRRDPVGCTPELDVIQGACRLVEPESGPGIQSYSPQRGDSHRGAQPLPGGLKGPVVCKADAECRTLQGVTVQ